MYGADSVMAVRGETQSKQMEEGRLFPVWSVAVCVCVCVSPRLPCALCERQGGV